ncbi:uncharacterized protein BO96DRAFT_435221 [Aspergillus niger CBS 101883]|uniref:Uncharacterized protein n=2 Tax=Aspergillus niger TaxID=5061 RepID=A2R5S1_ASPNC|nr:uncharacterized protein BO96DRAFT_435221 [Aspergillus niger CBS 101883]XP_059602568.1 hypothetical protein An15g05340 [Aspergillus niger]PYH55354.1 hypothetical protein BO96DRAFT_435221 [Aspergillus niger CBS 101883]CAK42507.1 hypothetical protein An15g05340 [Aspergillus niger]
MENDGFTIHNFTKKKSHRNLPAEADVSPSQRSRRAKPSGICLCKNRRLTALQLERQAFRIRLPHFHAAPGRPTIVISEIRSDPIKNRFPESGRSTNPIPVKLCALARQALTNQEIQLPVWEWLRKMFCLLVPIGAGAMDPNDSKGQPSPGEKLLTRKTLDSQLSLVLIPNPQLGCNNIIIGWLGPTAQLSPEQRRKENSSSSATRARTSFQG